jgi:hypothetical protein
MNKLFRAALLSAILMLILVSTANIAPRAYGRAVPVTASKNKKKNKSKPKKTKKILKGHHGKHKGKPA